MFHILKAFFPGEKIEQSMDTTSEHLVEITIEKETFRIPCVGASEITDRKLKKRFVNLKVYEFLTNITGRTLSWGIMTGVRPTKPIMEMLEEGKTDEAIGSWMQENYRVSEQKCQLGLEVAKKELSLLEQLDYEDGYSIYVGIPFWFCRRLRLLFRRFCFNRNSSPTRTFSG